MARETRDPDARRLSLARVGEVWQREMVRPDRYPRFLVTAAFALTFALVRAVTHALRRRQSPLARETHRGGGMQLGGLHIHHLAGGIGLLLLTGYLAVAVERPHPRDRLALLYGVGAALTLDEFALWLRLEDVYWAREGRTSVDAGVLAGIAFVLAALGRPFLAAVGREWRRSR